MRSQYDRGTVPRTRISLDLAWAPTRSVSILSMTSPGSSEDALRAQEERFAARDPALARDLYAPDVVYVSPTVRLFDWPARIVDIERTLEFIALTIRG